MSGPQELPCLRAGDTAGHNKGSPPFLKPTASRRLGKHRVIGAHGRPASFGHCKAAQGCHMWTETGRTATGGAPRGSTWQLAPWLILPNMPGQRGHLQHSPHVSMCMHAHTPPCTHLTPKYWDTHTFTHSHAAWGDMLGFQGIPKYLTPTARQYPLLSTAQHTTLSQRHGHPSLLRNTGRRCLAQPSSALGSHRVTPQLSEAYIWDAG